MAYIVWGRLRLEINDANQADHPQAEKETVLLHAIFDCFPPPGSRGFIEKPNSIPTELIPRYLRQQEAGDLLAHAPPVTGSGSALERTLDAIQRELAVKVDMPIFYTAGSYRPLLSIKPCFRATIYLRIRYVIKEIKVSADVALGSGANGFSIGDEIATYRIRVPDQFCFEKYYAHNPLCCPQAPGALPPKESSSWLPIRSHSVLDDLDREWKPMLRYEFEFRPRYRLAEEDDTDGDGD